MRWLDAGLALALVWVMSVSVGCSGRGAAFQASSRLDAGDAETVYREYEAKVKADPKDSEALVILAQAAARLGRDEVAIDALDRAHARGGKHRKLADATRSELWAMVTEAAYPALESGPRASAADVSVAHMAVTRAAHFDSTRAGMWAMRLLMSDDSTPELTQDEWVDTAVDRVDTTPEDLRWVVDALRLRARRHAKAGHHADAVEVLRRAHDIAPDRIDVTYDLGVHLHRLGESGGGDDAFRDAREQFATVAAALPDDAEARYNLALSCYRLADFDCVRAELDTLFHVRLDHPSAHTLAARLALADADTSAARGHVTAARALRGYEVPVPESALLVRSGPPASKRFVLVGRPTSIWRYTEKSGREVEVWFDVPRGEVIAYSDRKQAAEFRLSSRKESS